MVAEVIYPKKLVYAWARAIIRKEQEAGLNGAHYLKISKIQNYDFLMHVQKLLDQYRIYTRGRK